MSRHLVGLWALLISSNLLAQVNPAAGTPPTPAPTAAVATDNKDEAVEKPNGRRIRRNLNLIAGVPHDEELHLPDRLIEVKGIDVEKAIDIKRLKGTDIFRIIPKTAAAGIFTILDGKTKQVLAEVRYDIRDTSIEKVLREVQSLLGDVEGIEYKIVNGKILLDGYALLPKDIIRIGNVLKQFDGNVKSLVTLSPVARKKIFEFITRDVNNPEVSITPIGDFIKLEGIVNSETERKRIKDIIRIYMPDIVTDKVDGAFDHISIEGRSKAKSLDDLFIDLITIRKDEEKTEPPPKMIQVVVHFVQFFESYNKNFNFIFSPTVSTLAPGASAAPGGTATSTLSDTANLINNLLPKLQWAKKHNNARVLDTASLLTQDKKTANYTNTITLSERLPGPNGSVIDQPKSSANVSIAVTPSIKSERSGLVELTDMNVVVEDTLGATRNRHETRTTISVRDRWSAAFAGIIKKKIANDYGGSPSSGGTDTSQALVTFNSRKAYDKSSGNFVVFVTPIIKSSASAGVEQVKKKFRLRD